MANQLERRTAVEHTLRRKKQNVPMLVEEHKLTLTVKDVVDWLKSHAGNGISDATVLLEPTFDGTSVEIANGEGVFSGLTAVWVTPVEAPK